MTPVHNLANGVDGGTNGTVNGVRSGAHGFVNGIHGGDSDLVNGFQYPVQDNELSILTWIGSITLGLSLLLLLVFLSSFRMMPHHLKRSGKC